MDKRGVRLILELALTCATTLLPKKPKYAKPTTTAMMMREWRTVCESVKTAATVSPTESEIATLAHQLWQDNGCPVGSDKQDWFRAEATLKNALVVKGQDLSGGLSAPRDDNCTEFEMLAEF
jgi:hypothetical protein